jgi:lipopolysaccharide transport system ATP-binding protein
MQDISKGDGRTVLFVSHNMAAVQDLCTRVIILEHGTITFEGEISKGINKYLSNNSSYKGFVDFKKEENIERSRFSRFEMRNSDDKIVSGYNSGEAITFKVSVEVEKIIRNPVFSLRISDLNHVNIVTWRSNDFVEEPISKNQNKDFEIRLTSKNLYLLNGVYTVSIGLADGTEMLEAKIKFIEFEVHPSKPSEQYHSITKEKSTNSLIYAIAEWDVN